ncbi:hypothetical protein QAD02_011325 [Eretmocerus hayati]|uniref:Uncharacterized protein n=1 Tax=Eretmocerus hayati TaxID=131215 RepID=A0ACC2NWT4_9HYME|nr:hypothetical protein QAD02_011325 [Eretmocerus hayati]
MPHQVSVTLSVCPKLPYRTSLQTLRSRIGRGSSIKILVQPAAFLRFRYETETPKTFSRIHGKDPSGRPQGVPKVQLIGCDDYERAEIRCTLHSTGVAGAVGEEYRYPHPNQLIKKVDQAIEVEPITINVLRSNDFIGEFDGMSIIRIHVVDVMKRLLGKMKGEITEQKNWNEAVRNSMGDEEREINELETEAKEVKKSIDMHRVVLGFQGFYRGPGDQLYPITERVYSDPIKNSNSTSTARLQIHRIVQHPFGSCRGNEEIWLFVEQLNTKNTKVIFCELDIEGNETWTKTVPISGASNKYVLILSTPPYHDLNITQPKKVFIYLERLTDGSVSEMKPFVYNPSSERLSQIRDRLETPNQNIHLGLNGTRQVPNSLTLSEIPGESSIVNMSLPRGSCASLQQDPFPPGPSIANGGNEIPFEMPNSGVFPKPWNTWSASTFPSPSRGYPVGQDLPYLYP